MLDDMEKEQEEMMTEENSEKIEETAADDAEEGSRESVSSEEEQEAAAGEQSEDGGDSGEGHKTEKRKSRADKKGEKLKQRIEELEDRVKRQMAEFENFRKRTDKEKTAMFEVGAKSVIDKILPVVDNFERGLASIPEEEKGSSFAEGMNMVYKQLMTNLEELGVKPIEAVGEEFNPDYHNAVMQVESGEYEPGIVAQELQKGYMYRESVVRHSMVSVVK